MAGRQIFDRASRVEGLDELLVFVVRPLASQINIPGSANPDLTDFSMFATVGVDGSTDGSLGNNGSKKRPRPKRKKRFLSDG